MKIKSAMIAVVGCALSLNVMAGTMGSSVTEAYRPWSVIGSIGYTWYKDLYNGGSSADSSAQASIGDGQTALGRFAIARDLISFKKVRFGAEIGVQNGNTARLAIPQVTLDEIGGPSPQVTIKPMLDLLAVASWQPVESVPVFGIIKPGIAYRRLQVNDRVTFNDISAVAFELQAGVGMYISDRASLTLNYQGIFENNTTYTVKTTTYTGYISNIPAQNGLLLSISYKV